MAEHTPGPWTAETTAWSDGATVFAQADIGIYGAAPVADCTDYVQRRRPASECRANAHLTAAAPELLTQLQGLLAATRLVISAVGIDPEATNVDFRANGQPIANVRIADLLANADAAVAKAEGR